MTDRTLPHDSYITAVCDALTAADIELTDHCWTDDAETRGTYCYLNAVITLDPSGTVGEMPEDIPAGTAWPHGLLLIWEWHTGIEAEYGEPERGPIWQFAELKDDGSNEYPTGLPVYGYASPAAIVEAARKVIDHSIGAGHFHNGGVAKWDGGIIGDSWEHTALLDAACQAWGTDEGSDETPTASSQFAPRSATEAARLLASEGKHVDVVSEGHSVCLSGGCAPCTPSGAA